MGVTILPFFCWFSHILFDDLRTKCPASKVELPTYVLNGDYNTFKIVTYSSRFTMLLLINEQIAGLKYALVVFNIYGKNNEFLVHTIYGSKDYESRLTVSTYPKNTAYTQITFKSVTTWPDIRVMPTIDNVATIYKSKE